MKGRRDWSSRQRRQCVALVWNRTNGCTIRVSFCIIQIVRDGRVIADTMTSFFEAIVNAISCVLANGFHIEHSRAVDTMVCQ
jgi:hypothetical protein